MTSGSIVPYDPWFPAIAEGMTPQINEKHHPDFAQTVVIQSNKDALESDKDSFVDEPASISAYSTPDDESSPDNITAIRQQLNVKDEELTVRTMELTAEMKRHNKAMQIISDKYENEARASAEEVRTLRDDMKRIDSAMKERVTYSERHRDERQIISDMKMMQKALEARLVENA